MLAAHYCVHTTVHMNRIKSESMSPKRSTMRAVDMDNQAMTVVSPIEAPQYTLANNFFIEYNFYQ